MLFRSDFRLWVLALSDLVFVGLAHGPGSRLLGGSLVLFIVALPVFTSTTSPLRASISCAILSAVGRRPENTRNRMKFELTHNSGF